MLNSIHLISNLFVIFGGMFFIISILKIRTFPIFEQQKEDDYESSPLVSIVIPVHNEIEQLNRTLISITKQAYSNFEIIIVLDRCNDECNNYLKRLQENDSRIKFFEIHELPDNWLGKVNALNEGLKRAVGKYVVFTDCGDIWEKTTLVKAVNIAESFQLSHLTIIPNIIRKDFFQQLICSTFILTLIQFWILNLKNNKYLKLYRGFGAFNMVKSSDFNKTGGFEKLRLEVLDDFGVAKLMIENSFKSSWFIARKAVSRVWYNNFRESLKGSSKNLYYLLCDWQLVRFFPLLLFLILVIVVLFYSISFNDLALNIPIITLFVLQVIYAFVLNRKVNISLTSAFIFPFGLILYLICLINSVFQFHYKKVISWGGMEYSAKKLKEYKFL